MIESQNKVWGFYGTCQQMVEQDHITQSEVNEAWSLAFTEIATNSEKTDEEVRQFLDSKDGRYLADEVSNQLFSGLGLGESIEKAVAEFKNWRIF